MSESKIILVSGGQTGKKLHKAHRGSSCLGCGHWTGQAITIFQRADNIRPETLKEFKAAGHELCEKCFPGMGSVEAKGYTGPKIHMNNIRSPYLNGDGKVMMKRFHGAACRRNNASNTYTLKGFNGVYRDHPEQCCKGCVDKLLSIKEQAKKLTDQE